MGPGAAEFARSAPAVAAKDTPAPPSKAVSTRGSGPTVAASAAPQRKMVPVYDPVSKEFLPSSWSHLERMEKQLRIRRSQCEVNLKKMEVTLAKKTKDLSTMLSSDKPNRKKNRKLGVELKEMTTSVEEKKKDMATLRNDQLNMGRVRSLMDVSLDMALKLVGFGGYELELKRVSQRRF